MTLLNSFPDIENAYEPSGINFQNGYSAGSFTLPGELDPGVPVGYVHSYLIKSPAAAFTIPYQVTQANTPIMVNLTSFLGSNPQAFKKVRFGPNYEDQGYQLDYPRPVWFLADKTNVIVKFSFLDRYMNKCTVETNIQPPPNEYAGTNIGCNILTSIEITVPETTNFGFTFSPFFELPYTNLGIPSLVQNVIIRDLAVTDPIYTAPNYTVTIPNVTSVPVNPAYQLRNASWGVPPSNTTLGRPVIYPTFMNQPITNKDYLVKQLVFPTWSESLAETLLRKYNKVILREQFDSGEAITGIPTLNNNWIGWRG